MNYNEDVEYIDIQEESTVDNNATVKKKKGNTILKEILANSLYLLVVLVLTLLIVKYVGQRTVVVGHSMEPTLSNEDNLIVDKISYRFHEPERFDIVVFPFEYARDTYYIKRIIGLPGERVIIDDMGNIYINDELLIENYGAEVIENPGLALGGFLYGEEAIEHCDDMGEIVFHEGTTVNDTFLSYGGIVLGEDEYFVLGDNRNNSSDSRVPAVGNVKRDSIIGRAWLRIYPFNSIGFVKHGE